MKKYLVLLAFVIVGFTAYGQTFVQKGTVVDESGEPLIGVNVIHDGTSNGVITDVDGNFAITVPDRAVLIFSYIGYKMQIYRVNPEKDYIKITLVEDSMLLEEMVVVGHGYSVKADMVYSTGRVKGGKKSSAKVDKSKVGLLTAGEVNDFSKWFMWDSIVNKNFQSHVDTWKMKPSQRFLVQVTNQAGMPVVDVETELTDNNNNTIWKTRTDNTGKAELWADLFTSVQSGGKYTVSVKYNDTDTVIDAIPFSEGMNIVSLPVSCNERNEVDIMLIVDATGSMGDEITYLKNEFHDIIDKIRTSRSSLDVRVGSVFYRDHKDEYLTRKSSFDHDLSLTTDFIQEQSASGGGDYPEAVDEALFAAIEDEQWRENALARIAFLVLDAPAHTDEKSLAKLHRQIRLAAEKGIRIIPVICSGMDESGEYLMRTMALATNGTYVFLTDDSGIGDSHRKPKTDKYEVEILNDVIVRLVNQYTKMPDCNDDDWEKDLQKAVPEDKFVPNPYDENPEKKANKLQNKDVFKVYPNPCSDILKVDIKRGIKELFIVDISGKYLKRYEPSASATLDVDMSSYSAGVYFVKAYCSGRWFTEKVIVR